MGTASSGVWKSEAPKLPLPSRSQPVVLLLAAAIAAASMWFYVNRILVAHQVVDATAHERPRGNLSDLYPRWLGARELLLRHRNPYGDDITTEIQKGYYGRALDPARPNDPKDRQGFAYPVYVVFLLAPLINLPFHTVQIFFHWLLIALTALSVGLWLRVLRWRWPCLPIAAAILLTLGSVPAVQGIKLQQLSLLAAALLAGALACMASGLLFCGGVLLALATIKPQLALLLTTWLLVWAISDWGNRRRFVFGFGLSMTMMLAGAEILLPGWCRMFADAIQRYHRYTQNQSVLDQLVPWAFAGKIIAAAALLLSAFVLWKLRSSGANTEDFGQGAALVMALTVLVVPMYAPYNQVMLVPAILLLVRDRTMITARSGALRFCYVAGAFALAWQWIASIGLSGIYLFVSPALALDGWKWPFFATFALPLLAFALVFIDVQGGAASRAEGKLC